MGAYGIAFEESGKPSDWPANDREGLLTAVHDAMLRYVAEPGYKTKEVVLTLVCNFDLNQRFARGVWRVTEYEVRLINCLYLMAMEMNFNSVKSFLYSVVGCTARSQRMCASMMREVWMAGFRDDGLGVKEYSNLRPELFLYNAAYFRFRELRERETLCECIVQCVRIQVAAAATWSRRERVVRSFVTMMNDLGYQRGVRADGVIRFTRDEFSKLFAYEIELTTRQGQDPFKSPLKGVMMTQISNFVLKSRHEYNDDSLASHRCKITQA